MAVRHAVHDTATEELAPLADDGWVSVVIPYVREEGMLRCRTALLEDSSYTRFEVLAEYDAERVGCPKMVKRLVERSRCDYVCFLADDTIPQPGLLFEAMKVMATFEGAWGLVGLNTEFNSNDKHAAHWIASKKLLPYLNGEFFHVGYIHSYCDNELVGRCLSLGRYKFAPLTRLIHMHPFVTGNAADFDIERFRVLSKKVVLKDEELFMSRRSLWLNSKGGNNVE